MTLAACAVVATMGGCGEAHAGRSLLGRARSELLGERFTLGRLAGERSRPCPPTATAATGRPATCAQPRRPGTAAFARVQRLAVDVGQAAAADTSPGVLHALALLELHAAVGSGAALDRAVASLARARTAAPGDAALLNDLAVAHLESGLRDGRIGPMLRALDVVDEAVRRDSTSREALFNRALILERLHLAARASEAWAAYLAADSRGGWADEARARRRAIDAALDTLTARNYPQQARDASFRLFGEWGALVLRGAAGPADSLLRRAGIVGDSLDRLGADRTVALTAHWLRAMRAPRTGAVAAARALAALAEGIRLADAGRPEDAERALVSADSTLRRLDSPMGPWAALYRAAAEMNQGRYAAAERRLREVAGRASAEQPAVRGRAAWLLGTIALRQGAFEAANRSYAAARPYFVRARDAKSEAAISFLLTDGLALAGQTNESLAEAYRGLAGLMPYRQTVYLHNLLLGVAAHAKALGLRHATLDIVDEALAVGRTVRRADVLVLALTTHARARSALGDTAGALADLDSASRASDRLGGTSRRLASTSVDLERGRLVRGRAPRAALALLTRASDSYRALGVWAYASTALYELSRVARAVGETDVARDRLLEAVALIERPVGTFGSAEARSAFYETVEQVFDALVALEVDAGRPELAHEYLERERAAVWRRPPADGTTPAYHVASLASLARAAPRGLVLLSYAVLPDRLVVWFASRGGYGHRTVAVSRDSLARLVARFDREVAGTSTAELRTRAQLYSLLLAPVADRLARARDVAVVPDRELAGLPFAALWNPATGRYVVADHAVRTEPSGTFARAAWSLARRPERKGSALVVGNPALDGESAAHLDPLPGAAREARQVAALYPRARLLTGAGARRARVVASLAGPSVFHFAGHAVFDGDRPERSYLALAADRPGGSGRLEAREIAAMRLSNLDVVVLSACGTLNAQSSRTGAVAGLAFSFLRAGAPATVSTLWDVSDAVVVDVLVDLHRSLHAGADPAEALRQAQLAALQSPRPGLRAPAAWAAFVYSGP